MTDREERKLKFRRRHLESKTDDELREIRDTDNLETIERGFADLAEEILKERGIEE